MLNHCGLEDYKRIDKHLKTSSLAHDSIFAMFSFSDKQMSDMFIITNQSRAVVA